MRRKKNYFDTAEAFPQEGYTIVETMIFLAVSGLLFISAMVLVGGQQRKNEFNTGIRDIQSQLTDIMNDVSTGFYNNNGNISCNTTTPGSPDLSGPVLGQGTNPDCTFVGRVIQFAPNVSGDETAELYTLVGRRQTGTPATDVRTLGEAAPAILDQADTTLRLPYGIKIMSISYQDAGPKTAGSIGFVSRFGGNTGSGGITGTQDIDLIAVTGTALNDPIGYAKGKIKSDISTSDRNPDSGITLCFNSGGTKQYAKILIGGAGRQISTTLTIGNGGC